VRPTAEDFCWGGEVAPLAGVFAQLEPTGTYRAVLGGVTRDFMVPTRSDYERVLRDTGSLAKDAALEDDPALVAVVQAHWHSVGHNGCRFAVHLSEHRQRFGWETWVLRDRGGTTATADAIAAVAHDRLEPVDVDVLSCILPRSDTRALGDVVRSLGRRAGWKLTEKRDPLEHHLTLLCLSVEVDLGYWSEILGFGEGAALANTRRAPFTELVIRAKPPRGAQRKRRVNLADVPLDQDSSTVGRWGQETKRGRAERLGDAQNARGKARVTAVAEQSMGA
jgi:hypothetical protein